VLLAAALFLGIFRGVTLTHHPLVSHAFLTTSPFLTESYHI